MREYLKCLRRDTKMSQAELSLKIGISQNYYSEIENGNRQKEMNLTLIQKLAVAFNVPIEQIIAEEQNLQSTAS